MGRGLAKYFFFCTVCFGGLAADPPRYRLWLVSPDGKWDRQSSLFYREKLGRTDLVIMRSSERYKARPDLPMPVCEHFEYYLFSPADDLLRIGCVDPAFKPILVPVVQDAIRRYEADIESGKVPEFITAGTRR